MSTMEAELVAGALAMKEDVFCSKMMKELGFGTQFKQVPVNIDNTPLSTPSATRRSAPGPNISLFAFFTYESL